MQHLDRIRGGLLYAASSNVLWAALLARTFETSTRTIAVQGTELDGGGRLIIRAATCACRRGRLRKS